MGRVFEKTSCEFMMLDMGSKQSDPVVDSKNIFLEVEPIQGRRTGNGDIFPINENNNSNSLRILIKVKSCDCTNRCAMKRLREKHGEYVDCTMHFM